MKKMNRAQRRMQMAKSPSAGVEENAESTLDRFHEASKHEDRESTTTDRSALVEIADRENMASIGSTEITKNVKKDDGTPELLASFKAGSTPTVQAFKDLVLRLDNHQLLAKVFLLEGTPYVFRESPMKYVVFKEQVADQFDIGSQDVCIVGSARLGFTPSPHRYGEPFAASSDVDVVLVSFDLFDRGQRQLFSHLNKRGPSKQDLMTEDGNFRHSNVEIDATDWRRFKDAIRNLTYQNFNPGLLPPDDPLRIEIFDKTSSTSGLFLALEPQVFVSKIRSRIFRDWRAAEAYYTNSLRELKRALQGEINLAETIDDEVEPGTGENPAPSATKF